MQEAADDLVSLYKRVSLDDDLDDALTTLAADGIVPDRTGEIDGICRQAFLTDPSGNLVELTQPL